MLRNRIEYLQVHCDTTRIVLGDIVLVNCERCHRKFPSYTALSQHYERKHPAATKPTFLEEKIDNERSFALKPRTTYMKRSSTLKITVFSLILIIAVAVVAYAALNPPGQRGTKAVDVGSVAPDFTLTDTSGAVFTLSQYKGTRNVLLFFNEGLACSPCLDEMRNMEQLNQQFTTLNVVMASITADELSALSNWARASGIQYGKVMSDQSVQVARAYDMLGYSMHGTAPGHSFVLVNTSGVVVWRQDYYPPSMGPVGNSEILSKVTNALGA